MMDKGSLNWLSRLKLWVYKACLKVAGVPPVVDARISGAIIRKCIDKPDPVILDVGSNDGSHALWFRELFERPRIFCFEPDPRAIENFEKKVGNTDGIRLYKMALSNSDGEVVFYQSSGERIAPNGQVLTKDWDLSGSIRRPKKHLKIHPWIKFEKTIQVKTMKLDTWCNENCIREIDFIWMDVQGAELDVLQGGQGIFSKTNFIYSEYSNNELYEGQPTLKALLKGLPDFRVLVRYPNDVLLAHKRLRGDFSLQETLPEAGCRQ